MTAIGREARRTALLVGLVPLGLLGVHIAVPDSLRDAMVFDHSEVAIRTLWTSAFVHLDRAHLLQNLVGYVVGIVPTWLLFAYQGRHRLFRRLILGFVTILPPLLAIGNYVTFQAGLQAENTATRGFSGVVAAIFGLLFAAVLELVWARRGWREAFGIATSVVILAMLSILHRARSLSIEVLALGLAGVLLSLSIVVSADALRHLRPTVREYWREALVVSYCAAVLVVFLPLLFPIHWIQSGRVINIFGHATGLGLGFLAGVATMYASPLTTRTSESF